jgi:D-ribulokinase
MDHRAIEQADLINKEFESDGDCSPLRFVGGKISPEMQPCKILWLKHHLPETWKKMAKFMDLADFLTFQCTGSESKSSCRLPVELICSF